MASLSVLSCLAWELWRQGCMLGPEIMAQIMDQYGVQCLKSALKQGLV